MDPEDDELPLPITNKLERVQTLLVEVRDIVSYVHAWEYTREHNIASQRARRQRARGTAPVPQTPEPHKLMV